MISVISAKFKDLVSDKELSRIDIISDMVVEVGKTDEVVLCVRDILKASKSNSTRLFNIGCSSLLISLVFAIVLWISVMLS